MSEDALPRPRRGRRALLAIGRAVALLVLVTGINGALAIALPRLVPVSRYVVALVAGVAIFETLRPGAPRRPSAASPAVELAPPPADLLEAQRLIEELRTDAERIRSEAAERAAALRDDLTDLTQTNDALRQQLAQGEAIVAELHEQVAKARSAADEQSQLRARDADQARANQAQIREQYEAESEHLQSAASKALEEIQKTRASNDELRGQTERERAHARELESQLAGFDARLASALQELDALRADRQRVRRDLEETLQRSVVEKATLRKTLEAEWSAKLQKIVDELTRDHENDIGEAITARETARAEARSLAARVHELQGQLEKAQQSSQQAVNANEALSAQLQEERQRFYQELEEQKGALPVRVEELQQSLERERQLSREIAATRAQVEDENARLKAEPTTHREQIDAEWSAKLQKIVTELTMDHENDIGDSIAAREVARAETRSLHIRVQELEKQLENARDGRLGLLQRDDEVAQQFETERQARSALEEENAALKARLESVRERTDSEWSDKLQTIVSHIATDHEADIGKAIEEREAARAEARSLTIKVNSLQQKIDQDRKSFAATQEELNAKVQQLSAMRTEPPPPPPPPPIIPEPAISEDEERRARADVLEFAEHAHEALRRATSPGDVALPVEARRPRVLFVHHDPALRSMWRDNLDKNGFEVQTAADGLEGLRLAIAEKPDVVIADASMPKMDGRELCQLIKSNQDTTGVKVILLTGIYTNEGPMPSSQQEFEPDELLRKPVKLETMKAALSNLLAARVAG